MSRRFNETQEPLFTDDELVLRVLDDNHVRRYMEHGGGRCLFCGDNGIEGSSFDADSGGASQEISCSRCGGEWSDLHTLTGVFAGGEMMALAKKGRRMRKIGADS